MSATRVRKIARLEDVRVHELRRSFAERGAEPSQHRHWGPAL